ncbi:TniQ family protein [Actinokineospora sp. HUAS TT18]|uniref:TniQ family protein n=1 Tax=Actinokineospora sp. HUAS TT18 TaxID=3447451 RepID=UPI003F521BEC
MSRPLPRSLDPLPDESITGFVLRLAHRLQIPPARVVELTGLNTGHRSSTSALGLAVHVVPAARHAFAHATRLTAAETDKLFLSALGDRYPAAQPKRGPNRWGSTTYFDRWLFTRSTRYCPACLTGEDTELGRALGGAWRRTWRLPVVFVCTEHRRYLDHQCPACHHPVHLRHGGGHPQWGTTSLHPTQCRFSGGIGARDAERTACAAWLSAPQHPVGHPASTVSVAMLDLQHRIDAALDPQRPDRIDVLGRETAARHYFVDLEMMAYLVRVSWPLGRDFAAYPALADALDEHLADLNARFQATVRNPNSTGYNQSVQHFLKSPPLDALACATLLDIADHLLQLGSPHALSTEMRRLLAHDDRRPGKAAWSRTFLSGRPDCSEGMRQAVAPVLQSYTSARRSRGLSAPIRRTPFGPEHIAQFLQQDWYGKHLRHFTGIAEVHLRRGAALHLCQLAAGGSIKQAAGRLGLPDTPAVLDRCHSSAKALHRWTRARPDPHEFDTALHQLVDHLAATPDLIDYDRRRAALRGDWCIDAETWRWIADQLPPTEWVHGRQPQLGDRKRQSASIYVWAHVTGTEHVFAPHPLRDQQPADQQGAWRISDYAFWARLRQPRTRPHDSALRTLLDGYAGRLATHIDRTGHATTSLGPTLS